MRSIRIWAVTETFHNVPHNFMVFHCFINDIETNIELYAGAAVARQLSGWRWAILSYESWFYTKLRQNANTISLACKVSCFWNDSDNCDNHADARSLSWVQWESQGVRQYKRAFPGRSLQAWSSYSMLAQFPGADWMQRGQLGFSIWWEIYCHFHQAVHPISEKIGSASGTLCRRKVALSGALLTESIWPILREILL